MRKIDTKAYNKRLHTEIMELDKLIKSINPENVNQIDAGLIKTADEYIRLISDTTWADSSNFNGIELHKIKDIINNMKTSKKRLFIKRVFLGQESSDSATEWDGSRKVGYALIKIPVEKDFDGRASFVKCRFLARNISGPVNTMYINPLETSSLYEFGAKYIVRKTKENIYIEWKSEIPADWEGPFDVFYILWR